MRREQILYLKELHKTHSIHAASERLNISPQALGASIRALEKELGVILLDRSHTGVQLTPSGQSVIDLGNTFWENIDILASQAIPATDQNSLEMFVTYGCMHCFIPYMIKEFSQIYPSLSFNIHQATEEVVFDKLQSQAIPYALTVHCYIENSPHKILDKNMKFVPFAVGRLYAMVPYKSPLANSKQLSIKTLLKQPLLLYSPCPDADNSIYPLLHQHYGQPQQCEIQYNHIVYKSQLVTGKKIGLTFSTPFSESQQYKTFLRSVPIKENIYVYIGYIALQHQNTQKIEHLFSLLGLPPLAQK